MGWISKNAYLSRSEMENNADLVHVFFRSKGWTDNAIAAMLGNMQTESSINPGIWENLTVPPEGTTNVGYGLVQWTPYTKYSEWAGDSWQDNGPKQCERIIWELENNTQYYATASYPLTFREFTQSTQSPEYLAYAWLYNYERPASLNQPQRQTQARSWYTYITGRPAPTLDLPIWLLFKMRKR